MFDFLGSILGVFAALVVFGLMLLVVAYGLRSSERAVKDHDKKRRVHEKSQMAPATAIPQPRI